MYESNIIEKTKAGICSSISDAISFTENFSAIANAEYLITTNVAQKISELGPVKGSAPITIHLEMPTKDFASKCIPLFKKQTLDKSPGFRKTKTLFRKPKNTKRNGRIDLTVLKTGGYEGTPVCAIEVKGVNPSRIPIIKDLKRNLEYFKVFCETGESRIEFTAFCTIHTFNKSVLKSETQINFNLTTKKYKAYVSELNIPSNVEFEIKSFTASEQLLNKSDSQELYDDLSQELHHHVGVIVIFRWSSKA